MNHDFGQAPLMFYYEVTQACDLLCQHCRASAQPLAHPQELSHDESCALLDQVATFPQPPVVVFTGGDPLKRPDLLQLVRHARGLGLQIALTPSATPLATREAFHQAKQAGVSCLGISLDGADAATHDAFRGWKAALIGRCKCWASPASWACRCRSTRRSPGATYTSRRHGPSVRRPGHHDVVVFFLVPVGRGLLEERIGAAEYEDVFERLWYHSQHEPYAIKTTEAPHYRRFVLEHGGDPLAEPSKNRRGLAHFAESSEQNVPVPLSRRRRARWASATARA